MAKTTAAQRTAKGIAQGLSMGYTDTARRGTSPSRTDRLRGTHTNTSAYGTSTAWKGHGLYRRSDDGGTTGDERARAK